MNMKRTLIPLTLLLAACDASPPPQPQTEPPASQVFETQIQAVEKARAVEGQVLDAAAAQKQQIEAAAQQ
jgi:hypothetical protein